MYSLIEKETYHVRSWSDNLSTKCWKPWEHPLKHLLVRLERVSVKSSPNHIPQVKLSSSQIGPNRWRHSCYHLLTVISSGALLFSSRVLRPSLVTLCSHKVRSMCSWTLPCISSLVPSVLHLSHGFQCSPTLNPTKEGCHWQAGGENRQTWQLGNPAWYPGSRCGWTCNQLTSKVDGDITGSRLKWSILT